MKMFRYAVLLLALSGCLAKPNSTICTTYVTSYGPIPPALPESYMMGYEEANLIASTAFWFEEFFDFRNKRIRRKVVARGHEFHQIADYETEQVISYQSIYPGLIPLWDVRDLMSCYVDDIRDPKFIGQFGYRTGVDVMAPHRMYTSNLALKYGWPYYFAYSNKSQVSSERAAGVQQFVGCAYDEYADSTASMTVTWSTPDVLTASGETPSLMQIVEEGGRYVDNNISRWEAKKTVKEIVWYEGNPKPFYDMFELPPLMHCKGMRNSRELPTIPRAYSARSESAFWTEEYKGDQSVIYDNSNQFWYDADMQLARVDMNPAIASDQKVTNIFGVNEPLSAVLDYNTGLAYVSVLRTRECKVHQIKHGFPFMSKYTIETPIMATPESLFEIDSDTTFAYKGQRKVRGILCDIWSANKTSPTTPHADGQNFVEIAFAANDWRSASEEVESMKVPIQITELHAMPASFSDMGVSGSTAVVNFFHFKGAPPPLSVYDIGECFFHHVQRYFSIQFPGKFRDIILSDLATFMDTAQFTLATLGDLGSILRIQQLDYMFSHTSGTIGLSFAMLEKLPKVRYNKGLSILEAVQLLTLFVDNEDFIITLQNGTALPGLEPPKVNVTAVPGSFVEVIKPPIILPGHHRNIPEFQMPMETDHAAAGQSDSANGPSEPSGYTPGAVAGMAFGMLFLGLVVGVGGMILYLRRTRPTAQYDQEMK